VSGFRVRARTFAELHAYLTNEAVDLELNPLELVIDGTTVVVPNAFAFLLMKLHAFRDRMNAANDDDSRQLGRHHALDVYRVIAMLTEPDESFVRSRCAAEASPQMTPKISRKIACRRTSASYAVISLASRSSSILGIAA
jgi:hypothetical protein